MVGDLLEVHGKPGGFWLAVATTAWAMGWRMGLGVGVAALAEYGCFIVLAEWGARPPHGIDSIAKFSGWCVILLATATVYSAVRLGPRDETTRIAGTLALLGALDTFLWWMPPARAAAGFGVAIVFFLSAFTRERREALMRVVVGVVAAALPLLGAGFVITFATRGMCSQGCNPTLLNTPVLMLFPIGLFVSSGLMAWVLERRKHARAQLG
jgi:hypothetical protein